MGRKLPAELSLEESLDDDDDDEEDEEDDDEDDSFFFWTSGACLVLLFFSSELLDDSEELESLDFFDFLSPEVKKTFCYHFTTANDSLHKEPIHLLFQIKLS